MFKVVKRDGNIVEFDLNKIVMVITKAFDATGRNYHSSIIETLALKVTSKFDEKIVRGTISVEDIQDLVEETLSENGYADVSKAYILYRKQREKTRNISKALNDYKGIIDSYIDNKDEKIEGIYSIGGLITSNSSAITKSYWLDDIYEEKIKEAYENGDIYLHDLAVLSGENIGLSINKLLNEGFGGVGGMAYSSRPKHFSSFISQLTKYIEVVQYEWAGSISINSFDFYLAKFVREDNLDYKEVKQGIQTLIYELNVTTRWGYASPFTCLCLDLFDDNYQKEMNMINKAIKEVMIEGDSVGNSFTYPVICYNLKKEIEDGSLIYPNAVFISGSKKDLSSFYGYKEDRGSLGTVSINLGRLVNTYKNEEEYFNNVDKVLALALRSLSQKSDIINKLFSEGLYPLSKKYLNNLDSFTSAIDLIGIKNLNEFSNDLGFKTISYIKSKLPEKVNLRASNSINAATYFAKKDGIEKPYNLNISSKEDIFDIIDELSLYDEYFTGGMLAEIKTNGFNLDIVNKIAGNSSLSYFKIEVEN